MGERGRYKFSIFCISILQLNVFPPWDSRRVIRKVIIKVLIFSKVKFIHRFETILGKFLQISKNILLAACFYMNTVWPKVVLYNIQPWCDPIQYPDTGLPIKDETSKKTLQIRFSHFLTFVILDFQFLCQIIYWTYKGETLKGFCSYIISGSMLY